MKKCNICGAVISNDEKRCPNCGSKVIPVNKNKTRNKLFTKLMIVMIILFECASIAFKYFDINIFDWTTETDDIEEVATISNLAELKYKYPEYAKEIAPYREYLINKMTKYHSDQYFGFETYTIYSNGEKQAELYDSILLNGHSIDITLHKSEHEARLNIASESIINPEDYNSEVISVMADIADVESDDIFQAIRDFIEESQGDKLYKEMPLEGCTLSINYLTEDYIRATAYTKIALVLPVSLDK